jgi:two-component system chemotaxis response regulator CheY
MSYRILIVDDSNIVRKVFVKTLGMTNIPVGGLLEAGNGLEALNVLEREWIDLIFLDINMPVMDGVTFMNRLRAQTTHRETPVVIVSTEGSRVRRAELADLGISAYLRKPVTPEQLVKVFEETLGGAA